VKLHLSTLYFWLTKHSVFHVLNTYWNNQCLLLILLQPVHTVVSSTSFDLVTLCIWLGTTHPCNPPHLWNGLWVNLYLFMIYMYKHCFLPLLLVSVIKCCVKMHCSLPHKLIAAHFPHMCACFTCSSVHVSTLHSLLAHQHLSVYNNVDVYLCFFLAVFLFCFFCSGV